MDFSGLPENTDWIQIVPVRTPTLPPATHTNCYLVGKDPWLIVDPGSPYPDQGQELLAQISARPGQPCAIFLTHHHVDHVSGVGMLRDALQLPVWAHARTAEKIAPRMQVDRTIADGDILPLGERSVRAIYTPGHAPGHLCLWEESSRTLFAGDMVASVGTIIVEPDDDGDMLDYLHSLALLHTLNATCLLPAHGTPITDPNQKLTEYISHRMAREALVLAALTPKPQTLEQLLPAVYSDVNPAIFPLAKKSLLAHLLKLEKDGRAQPTQQGWHSALA